MASKCTKCGNTDNYNFTLNIGLCDICIGEKLERVDELEAEIKKVCDYINNEGEVNKWKILNWLEQAKNGRTKKLEDALQRIDTWAKAYPLRAFPEPDFKRAAKVLKAGGLSLDAISASNMRHVINGVRNIVEQALKR